MTDESASPPKQVNPSEPSGQITGIYIAPEARARVLSVRQATLCSGSGIIGDRYRMGQGTFSHWKRDHELTLIETEAIAAVEAEHPWRFAPGELRRNLETRGIRLNSLVGRRFRIGDVLCEGTRLCPPCEHLESLLGRQGLARAFVGRGGLRAIILQDGVIRVGDAITV